MTSLDQLLKTSIGGYRALLDLLRDMDERMAHLSAEQVVESCEHFQSLQETVQQSDQTLRPLLEQGGQSLQSQPEVREWLRLMSQVMELHRPLLLGLQGRKAILGAELSQLQGGITAMAGYRSMDKHGVARINSRC